MVVPNFLKELGNPPNFMKVYMMHLIKMATERIIAIQFSISEKQKVSFELLESLFRRNLKMKTQIFDEFYQTNSDIFCKLWDLNKLTLADHLQPDKTASDPEVLNDKNALAKSSEKRFECCKWKRNFISQLSSKERDVISDRISSIRRKREIRFLCCSNHEEESVLHLQLTEQNY